MVFEVELLPRAELETIDAISWYESRRKGLGQEFLLSLNFEIQRISNNPFQFPVSRNPFRKVIVRNFPFLIIYRVTEKNILIHSVFNTYQNPNRKP